MTDVSTVVPDEQSLPRFRKLLIGHDPAAPAEATLVLAAIAGLTGLRCDGELMPEAGEAAREPNLRKIERELGIGVDAVRRGARWLLDNGRVAKVGRGYYIPDPAVLAALWAPYRQRIKLTIEIRSAGLRPMVMLLAGLVAGQLDKRGRLCLGVGYLSQRLGCGNRTTERALMQARKAEVIHTWKTPPSWQLFLAMGPSRTGGSVAAAEREELSRIGGREDEPLPQDDADRAKRCEEAVSTVANRRSDRRDQAVSTWRSGGRTPDCPTEVPTDLHHGRAVARGGDDGSFLERGTKPGFGAEKEKKAVVAGQVQKLAERFEKDFASKQINRLEGEHEVAVAAVLHATLQAHEAVHPSQTRTHRGLGAVRELAHYTVRRHQSPARLARWLRRISSRDLTTLEEHIRRRYGEGAAA